MHPGDSGAFAAEPEGAVATGLTRCPHGLQMAHPFKHLHPWSSRKAHVCDLQPWAFFELLSPLSFVTCFQSVHPRLFVLTSLPLRPSQTTFQLKMEVSLQEGAALRWSCNPASGQKTWALHFCCLPFCHSCHRPPSGLTAPCLFTQAHQHCCRSPCGGHRGCLLRAFPPPWLGLDQSSVSFAFASLFLCHSSSSSCIS